MCALDLSPEFASLNVASMTFGESTFQNPPEEVRKAAAIMKQKGIKPEVECYDIGHIELARRLIENGLLVEPLRISLVLGVLGGIPAKREHLEYMLHCIPDGSRPNVICVGREQFSVLELALKLGCDIRVGMEDNIYLSKGVLARSNAELVTKMARIVEGSGKHVATPEQARTILGLKIK
jgi:3-keto-5-aminohexanoate cleavage enzyme